MARDPFNVRLETAERLLRQLVERLGAVHADERYRSVWTLYMIHGGHYTGPSYEKELTAAQDYLKTLENK